MLLQFVVHNREGTQTMSFTMPGRKIHTWDIWWSLRPFHWTSHTQSNQEEFKQSRTSFVLEVWSCRLIWLGLSPFSWGTNQTLQHVNTDNSSHCWFCKGGTPHHSWKFLFTQNCKLCWFIWLKRRDQPVRNCIHHWLWSLESSGMWCHIDW